MSGARPVHRKQNIIQQQKNPKQKTTIVLGDSMVKHQKEWDIGKAAGHRVVVKAFSGARTRDMVHYSKPRILQAPDQIILHCGTNDLHNSEPEAVANRIVDLAQQIKSSTEANVVISELVCRSDPALNEKVRGTNVLLARLCKQKNLHVINHSNITTQKLNRDGVHLLHSGNELMTNNFIYYSLYCVLGFSLAKSIQIILGICRCLRYFQRKQ